MSTDGTYAGFMKEIQGFLESKGMNHLFQRYHEYVYLTRGEDGYDLVHPADVKWAGDIEFSDIDEFSRSVERLLSRSIPKRCTTFSIRMVPDEKTSERNKVIVKYLRARNE
jgi:hypothetical protein